MGHHKWGYLPLERDPEPAGYHQSPVAQLIQTGKPQLPSGLPTPAGLCLTISLLKQTQAPEAQGQPLQEQPPAMPTSLWAHLMALCFHCSQGHSFAVKGSPSVG